jgi:hypothetical protein
MTNMLQNPKSYPGMLECWAAGSLENQRFQNFAFFYRRISYRKHVHFGF